MKKIYTFLIAVIFLSAASYAQEVDSLVNLSLEELMGIQVTSVSKKSESLKTIPSAIYVVTANDIERSAASNLVDLLQEQVPGIWIASLDYMRTDSYIRNTYSGSFVVLLDGTPMMDLLSAQFAFRSFDIPLSEISRIEVIKGSGGTVYGANSASGVISIFTKSYDKDHFKIGAKIGSPLYGSVETSAGKVFNDKFSVSAYGKYAYFKGFKQLPAIEESNPVVRSSILGAKDTTITNRFTGDDNTVHSYSLGLKLKYQIGPRLTITSDWHLNGSAANIYNQNFPLNGYYMSLNPASGPVPRSKDSVYLADDGRFKLVGNINANFDVSEKNKLFFRISTAYDKAHYNAGCGFNAKTSIIDFEIQDNFELPYNTLSAGANYRMLNYDIYDIVDKGTINYIEPQNNANLKGGFLQDKISLFDHKVNVYLGLKAENFSLINDKFYFSPMAKIEFSPSDKFTFWGGYSKSFTTPGYNQTNIELTVFRMKSQDFYSYVVPLQVYQETVNTLTKMGLDAATADQQAQQYLSTAEGQGTIMQYIGGGMQEYPGNYNIAVINGKNTEPTSFTNYEAGVRLQPVSQVYFEFSFFKSFFEDGVINSPVSFGTVPSPTKPGENLTPYYYGNFMKGYNMGTEAMIRIQPTQKIMLELSHTWFKYDMEYQENTSFDIKTLTAYQLDLVNEDFLVIPQQVFRGKVAFDLPHDIRFNLSGLYATAFYNRFGTNDPAYEYDLQRFDPIYGDKGLDAKTSFGKNDNRFKLNFRIDKYFMDNKLNLYLYGSDVTSSPFVESVNQLTTVYPRQIGRMIGLGINWSL